MTDHFNAIDYAHQLESAGVPVSQAEVHANALAQVLDSCISAATDTRSLKSELSYKISALELALRAEIKEVETTLRAEIKEVETKLRAEIKEVETKLRAEINASEARLEAKIEGVETRLKAEIQILRVEMRRMRLTNGIVIALAIAILAQGYFR